MFGTAEPQAIAERLLALVGLEERDERVIRRAWRSAQRLAADLDVLLVRPPEREPSAPERERIEALRRLASVLGAHLLVEEGTDPAEVTRRVARERGTHLRAARAAAARARATRPARAAADADRARAARRRRAHRGRSPAFLMAA